MHKGSLELVEVMVHYLAIRYEVHEELSDKWIARYIFEASIHAPNEAILLWWLGLNRKTIP